ncbi:MAG: hypothetical protein ACUVQ5_06705, partial [Candidatus Methanomethylicaceae archaeon]
MYQLLILNLNLLDVGGSRGLIAAARPLDEKSLKLASQYGIRPVIAHKADILAKKIVNEALKNLVPNDRGKN